MLLILLLGIIIGLCIPRLCPRCKIEKQWIKDAIKFAAEVKEKATEMRIDEANPNKAREKKP
jgi:hypothetical protein